MCEGVRLAGGGGGVDGGSSNGGDGGDDGSGAWMFCLSDFCAFCVG